MTAYRTMTNRELLAETCSKALLTGIENQRRFILRLHSVQQGCPNCGHKQNVFEAAGVEIDDYDFGKTPLAFKCGGCGRDLKHNVPFVSMGGPGWHWGLVPDAAQDHAQ
jgi:ribosomal protein S27E